MKFKYIVFFFLFSVLSQSVIFQDKTIDSSLDVLNKKPIDTTTAKNYLKVTGLYMNKGMVDSGYKYVVRGFALSKQFNYSKGMAVS